MDAASPESRLCIAALVAEYVRKTVAPDRRYRRVALLLADATGDELMALRSVCRAVEEVEHASLDLEWAERPIYIGVAGSKPPRVHVSSNRGEGNRVAAPFFDPPKALPEALLMLNRHGFSYPLEGFGRTIEIDGEHVSANDSNIVDRGEPVSSVLLLGVCLSVLP